MQPVITAAAVFFCIVTGAVTGAWAADPTALPGGGQKAGSIKAFSDADVAALRDGDDMGMAKVAALNGYPGPTEVLALGDELGLTDTQRQQVTVSLDHMRNAAKPLGADLIAHEQALDQLFAAETITPEALAEEMAAIGILQGRLRLVHLAAYLETRASLSPEQLALYHDLHRHAFRVGDLHEAKRVSVVAHGRADRTHNRHIRRPADAGLVDHARDPRPVTRK